MQPWVGMPGGAGWAPRAAGIRTPGPAHVTSWTSFRQTVSGHQSRRGRRQGFARLGRYIWRRVFHLPEPVGLAAGVCTPGPAYPAVLAPHTRAGWAGGRGSARPGRHIRRCWLCTVRSVGLAAGVRTPGPVHVASRASFTRGGGAGGRGVHARVGTSVSAGVVYQGRWGWWLGSARRGRHICRCWALPTRVGGAGGWGLHAGAGTPGGVCLSHQSVAGPASQGPAPLVRYVWQRGAQSPVVGGEGGSGRARREESGWRWRAVPVGDSTGPKV